ncbi:hypothetical protein [Gimesia sp.]|mgnify:CR=1 FL=1|uniref:hypothetical protein n=1 Tax=Gimesia sp. TaxID=2024833 RepID=UPI000C42B6F4|nr:hypothetical protein [Gimesia sp.]MAX35314.1 hypothetical protein [Gimesia sp.]HAH45850.1 hypothetical protein [Planctomycetaceae bacterium]|tara:strand:+ start:1333 stop:1860 length:528 start_codon:yes stop_codon:yes gene_type:complete
MNRSQRKPSGSYIVSSEKYRWYIIGTIAIFLILSGLLIIFGKWVHHYFEQVGVESNSEYQSAFLSYIGTYLPIMTLIVRWMDFENWNELRKEKTHRWQGWVSMIIVTLLAIGSLSWLISIIALSDYRVIKEGTTEPAVDPDLLLSMRLYTYFTYQALGWSLLYFFGLFKQEPQKS